MAQKHKKAHVFIRDLLQMINKFASLLLIDMASPYQILDWYGGRHTCHTASGALAIASKRRHRNESYPNILQCRSIYIPFHFFVKHFNTIQLINYWLILIDRLTETWFKCGTCGVLIGKVRDAMLLQCKTCTQVSGARFWYQFLVQRNWVVCHPSKTLLLWDKEWVQRIQCRMDQWSCRPIGTDCHHREMQIFPCHQTSTNTANTV